MQPVAAQSIDELVVAISPPPPPPNDPPPPPLPSLEQLEVSLNPGAGGDLTIGTGFEINFETESAEQLMSRYGFDDLDEVPRVMVALSLPRSSSVDAWRAMFSYLFL
ncbi:MAG: hypothetical protein ACI8Z5_001298 [Lentimonas sp.]|jgi:hypothetical protein